MKKNNHTKRWIFPEYKVQERERKITEKKTSYGRQELYLDMGKHQNQSKKKKNRKRKNYL